MTMFFSSVFVLLFLFFHSSLAQPTNFQVQTLTAKFSPRVGSSYLVIPPQSKIAGAGAYVIGGRESGNSNLLNEIYVSSDSGVAWKSVGFFPVSIGNAIPALYVDSLVPQEYEVVAVFGQSGDSITSDVWSTTSSLALSSWVQTTAPYSPRFDHSVAVLDYQGERYVFVMGGAGAGGAIFNDVWFSNAKDISNAANVWTNLTSSAPWSPRSGMAVASFHDNSRIVVAGGKGSSSSDYYQDVYVLAVDYEFNPQWTTVTTSTFPIRAYGAMFNLNEYLYFTSGRDSSNLYNDLLKSVDDGKTWISAFTGNANYPVRINPLVFVFNNQAVVASGGGSGSSAYNDVWAAALG